MQRRVHNPSSRSLFLSVLHKRSQLFKEPQAPTLCHEDLNPYNLLFTLQHGHPVLAGILDWESAWSSLGESDMARLELWRDTRGPSLRQGYEEIRPLPAGYEHRRPVLQLLWALEYAEHFPVSALHQADLDMLCRSLDVPALNFR
jgi:fructosamine-3-kinase